MPRCHGAIAGQASSGHCLSVAQGVEVGLLAQLLLPEAGLGGGHHDGAAKQTKSHILFFYINFKS